jgi:hypothetical protein
MKKIILSLFMMMACVNAASSSHHVAGTTSHLTRAEFMQGLAGAMTAKDSNAVGIVMNTYLDNELTPKIDEKISVLMNKPEILGKKIRHKLANLLTKTAILDLIPGFKDEFEKDMTKFIPETDFSLSVDTTIGGIRIKSDGNATDLLNTVLQVIWKKDDLKSHLRGSLFMHLFANDIERGGRKLSNGLASQAIKWILLEACVEGAWALFPLNKDIIGSIDAQAIFTRKAQITEADYIERLKVLKPRTKIDYAKAQERVARWNKQKRWYTA